MPETSMRAGIYARLSDDREKDELGVQRQLKLGRALVKQRGGTVVLERFDDDISALHAKPRDGYDAIMAAAEAGEIDTIVLFQSSRLWRNRQQRAESIERLGKAKVSLVAVKGPDLDLANAYGRGLAGLMGEFDTMESEVKSERILAKVEELAEQGRIANGGPRPFGYDRVFVGEGTRRKIIRDDINEAEAEVIRDCAKRVLHGESLSSIVRDLNERGIKTTTVGQPRPRKGKAVRLNADGSPELSDGRWSQQGLRLMLRSGRIAGLREHKGVIVGKAVWPAIIDVETHEQLRAELDRNERPGASSGTGWVRKYYLTGWVFCGNCLAKNLKMKPKSHHQKAKYVCLSKAEGGCNGRVIAVRDLERFMDLYMVKKMNDPKTLRELAARRSANDRLSADLIKKIEADERRLKFLKSALDDGDEEELPEVVASVRQVRQRLTSMRQELGRATRMPELADQSLPELAVLWPDLPLERKRSLLALFVDRIVIGPGRRGLGMFDPSRIDVVPAGSRY